MSCSFFNCKQAPLFICSCKDSCVLLCSNHLAEHSKDDSTQHLVTSIELSDIEDPSILLIRYFSQIKTKATLLQSSIINDTKDFIDSLTRRSMGHITKLQLFVLEIDSIINLISNHKTNLADGSLKSALNSIKNAREKSKEWQLIKSEFSSEAMKASIQSWGSITVNIKSLYSDEEDISEAIHLSLSQSFRPSQFSTESTIVSSKTENFSSSLSVMKKPCNTLTCFQGHEMQWQMFMPYEQYKSSNSFMIVCALCKNFFSKSCWNCSLCKFNICEKCGISKGFKPLKIVCNRNHELELRSDANIYYESKGIGRFYTCQCCEERKTDTHWHCRKCEYDICIDCGKVIGFSPPSLELMCNNNHIMQESMPTIVDSFLVSGECNKCFQFCYDNHFCCKPCKYYICCECYIFQSKPLPCHPVLACESGHILHWEEEKLEFKCEYCKIKGNQESFYCKYCTFHTCLDCSYKLISVFLNDSFKNVEGSKLVWKSRAEEVVTGDLECTFCNLYIGRAGYFVGNQNLKLCLNCYCNNDLIIENS